MVCGFLGCDRAEGNPVLSTLPPLLKLDVEQSGAAEWIRSTFQYVAEEVAAGRPGSETVLAKLSELLFVEAVRRYAEALPQDQTGWLAGLRDPYVARALALLHSNIARPWNVDDLGREVGLSRSALADRFIRLIGVPSLEQSCFLIHKERHQPFPAKAHRPALGFEKSIQKILGIASRIEVEPKAAAVVPRLISPPRSEIGPLLH
jgi:hypothetical protein